MRTAARLFQQSCYRYREELSAGIIVAGWDPRRGGQVGSLQSPFSALQCPLFCPSVSFFPPCSVPLSVPECLFLLPQCLLFCPGVSRSAPHLLLPPGILFSALQPPHLPAL